MRRREAPSPAGSGHGSRLWPVLLLLMAGVVLPTTCVVWLMTAAVGNMRIAVRQRLLEAYQDQLQTAVAAANLHWRDAVEQAAFSARSMPAAEAFAMLVRGKVCESAVFYGGPGVLEYPTSAPGPSGTGTPMGGPDWAEAANLEYVRKDYSAAADAYARIARGAQDAGTGAHALEAQARCLARTGRSDDALNILQTTLAAPRYADARDSRGRLIGPNARLMALELIGDPKDQQFRGLLAELAQRLNGYSGPDMPSLQRRFLMHRLLELAPGQVTFPTLEAEDMAAEYVASSSPPASRAALTPSSVPGVWQLVAAEARVVALYRTSSIEGALTGAIARTSVTDRARVAVRPPGIQRSGAEPFVTLAADGYLSGWSLDLYLQGEDPFAQASSRQIAIYVWTVFLVMVATGATSVLVGRHLLRQGRLARLKNDFVATVSHELKTPLASMRVLVDTLLEGNYRDQQQVDDYLRLISHENLRLSHLIDNFLGFSRMERGKRAFDMVPVQPSQIVSEAVAAVRNRLQDAGCRFGVETAADMPFVTGDCDALVTVLVNLLDNALKYTGEDKEISLRAWAQDGEVLFEVRDNGIGISRRALRHIFDRFYRVDQRLSRNTEGCGLGLSIVKFIVDTHGGSVDVTSEPSKGSTFTVKLPARGRT